MSAVDAGTVNRAVTSPRSDYTVTQKVLHWLMAILIIMDLFVAQKLGGLLEDWDRLESRVDHGSLGTIVCILLIVRLVLRARHGAPPLPATMPEWQKTAAHVGHWALYVALSLLIVAGVLTAMNAAAPIALFGQFDITIGQSDETTFAFLRQFHEIGTNIVIALIALHVAAALHHHFIAKDKIVVRMLKFWRSD